VVLCALRFIIPFFFPAAFAVGVIGGVLIGLAIFVWWAFFSRAPRFERWGGIILMVLALVGTFHIVHVSIRTGMMGMMFAIYSIPVLSLALVAWAAASRHLSETLRRASMVATILLACGLWTLVRTEGITGQGGSELAWRWAKTPEERLLDPSLQDPAPLASTPTTMTNMPEWPGFRGRDRDGIIHGVRIETNWVKSPPIELWRRAIGPGWSSFAVSGDLFYTQDQRGDDEVVDSYKMSTGEPMWRHRDAVRFWESNAGAGPRATPTLDNGRVYTFGATGILNALDASNGALVWSRNVASDADKKVPGWGFASSPLVVEDLVIVAASGKLVGYDIATGKPRWFGPAHGGSYSSPQLATIGGVTQILMLSGAGVTSVEPASGTLLWEHAWPGVTIVQPALLDGGDILISTGGAAGGLGVRRLAVAHRAGGWTVEQRWTSAGLKPYFNDLVVHKGNVYGFDGSILACIGLEDGKRKWKDGRYGNGQLVLLRDQDALLVLSEEGELVLIAAVPDEFRELARFPAIKGKTWNHPVLVGDVLLVRNAQEMAAFRLSLAGRQVAAAK
jgi:outer membrane protein assembly factor BamB